MMAQSESDASYVGVQFALVAGIPRARRARGAVRIPSIKESVICVCFAALAPKLTALELHLSLGGTDCDQVVRVVMTHLARLPKLQRLCL